MTRILKLSFDCLANLFCRTLFALCKVQVIPSCILASGSWPIVTIFATKFVNHSFKVLTNLVQEISILWIAYVLRCADFIKDNRFAVLGLGRANWRYLSNLYRCLSSKYKVFHETSIFSALPLYRGIGKNAAN